MKENSRLQIILLFLGNFCLRLPFLFAGYGREEDAWAHALNARIIWETKIYEVSRLPGHPLYELFLSLLWPIQHAYWFFNGISALASSLAIVYLYLIGKELRLLNALWISIAFGFIPAFFIAGTYTIDYTIGLLFVLISFYQLLKGRYWTAGIFIGMATGMRISHLGFILPWALMAFARQNTLRPALKVAVAAIAVGVICFLPPLLTYGVAFLDFHKPPYPPLASIFYKLSFGLWGVPLLFFLLWFWISHIFKPLRFWLLGDFNIRLPRAFFLSLLVIFFMQLAVFLRLPYKSEFLIPFLPFFMIYLGALMKERMAAVMAMVAVLSCFLFGFDYQSNFRGSPSSSLALNFEAGGKILFFDPLQGPAIIDHRKREVKSKLADEVLSWSKTRTKPAFVIAGWYWPELEVKRSKLPADQQDATVVLDYYSTRKELLQARKEGREIFYLPEINQANAQINAHYLADSLGKEWLPR